MSRAAADRSQAARGTRCSTAATAAPEAKPTSESRLPGHPEAKQHGGEGGREARGAATPAHCPPRPLAAGGRRGLAAADLFPNRGALSPFLQVS